MEIIRKTPGKIYYKSNTSIVIKLLAFLAVILVLLVLGVCIFVIFGLGSTKNLFLHDSQTFYYAVNKDAKTAIFEMYVGKDVTEYTVPNTVSHKGSTYRITEISAQAFTNNQKLVKVTIGDNVERIMGDTDKATGAFAGCTKLQTVNLGNNLRHIDNYAFKNCLQLKILDLPSTLQFVGTGSFMNNLALTQIKLNSSNTRLATNSFQYCTNLTTLELSDTVVLGNDQKEALADLRNLSSFVLNTNPDYQVANNCLLNAAGDTVVLGGVSTTQPTFAGITVIEDWAFGNRYGDTNIYLPATLTTVGAYAFTNNESNVIYTNADTKPAGWQTLLPVRCNAQKVTFYRGYDVDDTVTADAYVFTTNPNDEAHYLLQDDVYYPTFAALFGEADGKHEFEKWGAITADGKCYAQYYNGNVATDFTALNDAITEADGYLNDKNKRLEYTLTFWEDFKSVYGVAKGVAGKSSALDYEVKNATANLQKCLTKIAQPDDTIKVNTTDWRVGLQDLMAVVEVVINNPSDFIDDPDVWANIKSVYNDEAKKCLEDEECSNTKGISAWRVLRGHYEELRVDIANSDAPLNKLIDECATLNADDYTVESWEKLQNALTQARSITQYNMSVTQVRLDLQNAKDNLVENNLASYEQMVELAAWLSLCGDLPAGDYAQNSYDKMLIAWRGAKARFVNGTTDTVKEVDTDLKLLQSCYNTLEIVDKKPNTTAGNAVTSSLVPYFIVALVLFTVAIIIQAVASSLKKSQRSKNRE